MKKKIILIIQLVLVGAHLSYGQQNIQHNASISWNMYAEGGWCLSTFHSQDKSLKPDFSSVSGVNLGVGINMRFMDVPDGGRPVEEGLFAFQSGIHFLSSGFKVEKEKVSCNYISIPVYFQYYPISQLYVETGIEMCINTSLSPSSAEVMGMNLDLHNHHANDFKFGLGAGYYFPFKFKGDNNKHNQSIGLSAKYLFGTSDFAENLPWKNEQIRLSVFYRFGL